MNRCLLLLLGCLILPSWAAAQMCTGDCDGSGAVTVDELVTALNIGLGNRPLGDCPAADSSNDDRVTVDEIVTAVNFALVGCPISAPTPTATTTAFPTATATLPADALRLEAGSAAGAPGAVVRIPFTLANNEDGVAVAVSTDVTYDSTRIRIVAVEGSPCEINPAIGSGTLLNKMLISNILGGDGLTETFRVGVFGLNVLPLPNGEVFSCDFRILPGTPAGMVILENSAGASDAEGNPPPIFGGDGLITIQ